MIRAAIAAGLSEIGITSHAPLPFDTEWTMELPRLAAYVEEVRSLAERYRERIAVLVGAEIDYIPGSAVNEFQVREVFPLSFDYFVGSVHFLGPDDRPRSFDGSEEVFRDILRVDYRGDIQSIVDDYYRRVRQMLDMPGVKIVGHLDLIKRWNADRTYFEGREPWYVQVIEDTLSAVAARGRIVELNTAGWRKGLGEPYPAPWILARCRDLGIPVTIGSDAHAPEQVTWGFDRASACLEELGITPIRLPAAP
jgi:histidinol-phosphatase (PHP family)